MTLNIMLTDHHKHNWEFLVLSSTSVSELV